MGKIGDITLCLTTGGERQRMAEKEFERNCVDVEFFQAIDGATPFESFNKSQYVMIERAAKSGAQVACMFEDDVIFKNSSHFSYATAQLPHGWDIMYLGANITGGGAAEVCASGVPYLWRITHAWTTHALLYSSKAMQFILEKYDPLSGQMYDDWLTRNIVSRGMSFCVSPMICWQRPGKSELWGRDTDYSPCFEQGNKMMGQ